MGVDRQLRQSSSSVFARAIDFDYEPKAKWFQTDEG